MPIFKEEGGKYKKLPIEGFKRERTLQTLVEDNLFELLDLHFLATEYTTTFGGRIDTLAVDLHGAPVIIEYKLSKNENVINQGLSYLLWLKAQKVEFFEMLLIKKLGKEISEQIKIDWNNPRVICIAENYSKYDLDTVQVVPIRIELFKYRIYEQGIFNLEALNTVEKADKHTEVSKRDGVKKTTSEMSKPSVDITELFQEFRSRIIALDEEITEKETSLYFAFRVSKNFAEVYLGKKALKVYLRPVNYIDPENKVEKIPDSYNWVMNRRVYVSQKHELDYVMQLIEQSYRDVI